ncbi:uncharacterized [Tachysurus ichikawai]
MLELQGYIARPSGTCAAGIYRSRCMTLMGHTLMEPLEYTARTSGTHTDGTSITHYAGISRIHADDASRLLLWNCKVTLLDTQGLTLLASQGHTLESHRLALMEPRGHTLLETQGHTFLEPQGHAAGTSWTRCRNLTDTLQEPQGPIVGPSRIHAMCCTHLLLQTPQCEVLT